MIKKIALLLILVFSLSICVSATTYCSGEYDDADGDWDITTDISCSDENIIILGSLNVGVTGETPVTSYSESTSPVYDLSGNSTSISAAIPAIDSDVAGFTNDWHQDNNNVVKFLMNESENIVQIYSDVEKNVSWLYGLNLDGSDDSGLDGMDLAWGYLNDSEYGVDDIFIGIYNESADSGEGDLQYDITGDGSGSFTINSDNGYDSGLEQNYTVYYNISGTELSIIADTTGSWSDKYSGALDWNADSDIFPSTTLKNSAYVPSVGGNLTLSNIGLNFTGDIVIGDIAEFDADDVDFIVMGADNGLVIESDMGVIINNSNYQANGSQYNWAHITGNDVTIQNTFLDGIGYSGDDANYEADGFYFSGVTSGLVKNASINSSGGYGLVLYDTSNLIIEESSGESFDVNIGDSCYDNIIRNNGNIHSIIFDGETTYPYNNLIYNNTITYRMVFSEYDSEDEEYTAGEDNIFWNNNVSNAWIEDVYLSVSNIFVYNNTYGEIKWDLTNISLDSEDSNKYISLGTNIYLENNLVGANINSFTTNLNDTAQIKFFDLSWARDVQLCTNIGGTISDCIVCDDTNNCSYLDNTLTVNVTHFSNYSTNGTINVVPNVTLISPPDAQSNTSNLLQQTFTCNFTDDYNMTSMSLYLTNNQNTSFALNQTNTTISGTSGSVSWDVSLNSGNYTWNCLGYDVDGGLDWADTNRTLVVEPIPTYCGGLYISGDWTINSSVSCSDETIPVTGNLLIDYISSTAVTLFTTDNEGYYDLSGNSTSITNAIPDEDKTTPSQYTDDWDSNTPDFYIVMNESEHKIQMFADMISTTNYLYYVDIDDDESSGDANGNDLLFGYYSGAGGYIIGGWNSTLGDNQIFTSGQTIDTNMDVNLANNFTLYFNQTGTTWEIVIDVTGVWVDKSITSFDLLGNYWYTTFTNSPSVEYIGNLTLDHVNLNVTGNITVEANTYFNADNTNFTIQTTDNSSGMQIQSSTGVVINNSKYETNQSGYSWIYITGDDVTIEDTYIDWTIGPNALNSAVNGLNFNSVSSGMLSEITLGNWSDSISIYDSSGIIIQYGTDDSDSDNIFTVSLMQGSSNNTIQHISELSSILFSGNSYNNLVYNNTIDYAIQLSDTTFGYAGYNNVLWNNNISSGVEDENSSTYDIMVYNNTFGEVKWNSTNLTFSSQFWVDRPTIALNTDIYLEDNLIGVNIRDANYSILNTTATIKFFNLSWDGETQLCNKEADNLTNCVVCNATNNCVYDEGTMIATVTHFSNYTTNGSTAADPSVTLISPEDAYSNATLTNMTFIYQVSDTLAISSCSLYLGDVLNQTNTSITKGVNLSFYVDPITDGTYDWFVSCNDSDNNRGNSSEWTFILSTEETEDNETSGGGGGGSEEVSLIISKEEELNYELGDEVCDLDNGENYDNSPEDCKPTVKTYASCLFNGRNCYYDDMKSHALLGLVGILSFLYFLKIKYKIII